MHVFDITDRSATLPIDAATMRTYMVDVESSDDPLITALIEDAVDEIEGRTDIILQTCTGKAYFSAWQDCYSFDHRKIRSITSIKYFDSNDVEQSVDPSQYYLDQRTSEIIFSSKYDFPDLSENKVRPITIEVSLGWLLADSDFPRRLRQALRKLVTYYHENRDNEAQDRKTAVDRILSNLETLAIR